jgi:hypothetical protein
MTGAEELKIEVGQVWQLEDRLVMVSFLKSPAEVLVGKAEKRGSTYAIVDSPTPISDGELRRGKFIFDTEA